MTGGKKNLPHKKKTMRKPRGVSWAQIAQKAWSGVKAIRGIVNSEKFHFDAGTQVNPDYNGAVVALSAISQGDGTGSRTGNSILAKGLVFNFNLSNDTGAQTTTTRIIVFQDTMSLGTIPSPSDVLTAVGNVNGVISPYTLINSDQRRFKILMDEAFATSNTGNQKIVKFQNLRVDDHIKFSGTSGTDEARNMVYMLHISDRVTTLLPTLNWYSRLSYYDN